MVFQNRDLWAGILILLLGALLLAILIPTGIDEPRKVKFAVMSPSYFPRIVAIAMVLVGLAITAGAAMNKAPEPMFEGLSSLAAVKVCIVFLIFLATALALPSAGFLLTCVFAAAALMLLAGERNPVIICLVSILLPIALHLFFTKIANVPIPGGILDPYLQRI